MEDKKISEMAELLCKGAKMLSHYCPECGVPLFKEGDRIFCPSCGKTAVFEDEIKEVKKNKSNESKHLEKSDVKLTSLVSSKEKEEERENGIESVEYRVSEKSKKSKSELGGDIERARKSVKFVIVKLCKKMEEEEDISSLLKVIEALERLISIYNNLKTIA